MRSSEPAVPYYQHIPNGLTVLRIFLIPVFVILLIKPDQNDLIAAACVFAFAAMTDYVDGLLARRWNVVSDLGKLLDPLADKILVMSALVMLCAQRSDLYGQPWIPGWLVVIILAREFWVTGVRGLAASKGLVIAAGDAGKIKSFLQMSGILLILLRDIKFQLFMREISLEVIGMNLLLVSVLLSYWGAIDYSSKTFAAFRERPASGEE